MVTVKDVEEVENALEIMCKWCEQGICDYCPDKETLQRVKAAHECKNIDEEESD